MAEDPVELLHLLHLHKKVYGELRALAASYFPNTLQPTALVNEAFLRLAKHDGEIKDRAHFFAVAATAMRQILTDRARRRRALKRGGPEKERVTLSGIPAPDGGVDLLVRRSAVAPRCARRATGAARRAALLRRAHRGRSRRDPRRLAAHGAEGLAQRQGLAARRARA